MWFLAYYQRRMYAVTGYGDLCQKLRGRERLPHISICQMEVWHLHEHGVEAHNDNGRWLVRPTLQFPKHFEP
jgi:hypothetical protein